MAYTGTNQKEENDPQSFCNKGPEESEEDGDSISVFPELLERRGSLWDTEESTTPMTTRPHFATVRPSSRPLQSACDEPLTCDADEDRIRFSECSLLALPPLHHGDEERGRRSARASTASTRSTIDGEPSSLLRNTSSIGRSSKENSWTVSVVYGTINAIIVLPILMSFGSIIYRDDAFAPYMPVLVKLTLVSGVVHQLCFSTFSSLPFAVGQVQDAGLIFLSSMASAIVQYCRSQGHDEEIMLATVTVGLSIATAILGLGLVLVGYLRLAQYVKHLPTSVVGGYLAFIGWFCGVSGIGLMAGSSDVTPSVVVDRFRYVVPGLLFGSVIYLVSRRLRHMAVLPIGILFVVLLFYGVLWTTDTTVAEATRNGWIREMEPPPVWYRTWDFLRLDKVDWYVFQSLALTELSMILVVALSSSLDVAAIELELKRPLDYNHELKMVGLSNVVSGSLGGYTGSHIFSQSIFSLRAGIRSQLAGYVLAMCQILFLVLPVPILAYVPNFFFGSLLSMICIDLMFEWLWDVRHKLTSTEYAICLATFGLIHILSVQYGILAGVALHVICKNLGLDVGDPKISLPLVASADEDFGEEEMPPLNRALDDRPSNYGSI